MKTRRLRLTVVLTFLLAFSAVSLQAMEHVGEQSCVTQWSQCRADATTAFFNNEVGTVRYSLMLSGCDIGYGYCVTIGM
jgi:hypothetical protein